MKLTTLIATTTFLLTLILSTAHAGDRHLGGLIIGGGTGAIVGQAIGHNAESTIVGATIGGVVGLLVGNQLERQHTHVVSYPQHYRPLRRPVVQHFAPNYHKHSTYYRKDRQYRKVVIINDGPKRIKRVVTTYRGNGPAHHYKTIGQTKRDKRYHR